MRRTATLCVGLGSFLAVLGSLIPVLARQQQTPPAPSFRSRVSVVPVDVRVVDGNGKPVTGLNARDFVVSEDGTPQELRHFSEYALVPEQTASNLPPALYGQQGNALAPQKARIFLFVLGRGRLQEPSKAMDALLRFVREGLLPQDQVALLAWNRATSFTTDHQKVERTIERFKNLHSEIEAQLAEWVAGQEVYGTRQPTPAIQKRIDDVFHDPGATSGAEDTRLGADTVRSSITAVDTHALAAPLDETARRDAGRFNVTFEQFVKDSIQRDQDLGNLYTGIEYLRYIDGEKHLVFLTQGGIVLDRMDDDLSLAAMANDARVALDTVQTGGLAGAPAPSVWGFKPSLMEQAETIARNQGKPNIREELAFQTLRNLSQLTGGVSSVAAFAGPAFARLDEVTRGGYLLGYYPTNGTWNGKYRKIRVTVNRRGLTAMFRHGYYARDVVAPLDRRSFVTFNRVTVAGSYDRRLTDLKVSLKVEDSAGPAPGAAVAVVEVMIDLSHVAFTTEGDRHVASLDVNIFCGDDKERLVGESWQKADLRLTDATFERLRRDGYVHRTSIPLKGKARYVKAVVYDYASDLIGSAMASSK
jgi:VWFA-related protein